MGLNADSTKVENHVYNSCIIINKGDRHYEWFTSAME